MSSADLPVSFIDQELLQQIARGDEQAFDRLYESYNLAVYRYALSLVGDPAVAEEILQDVFLAVWKGADRFRYQAQIKTWLLRIAHYRAMSRLRQNNMAAALDEIEDVPDELAIEDLYANPDLERVQAAVLQLSPKLRAVVELAFMHDLSYAEIASVVNIPIGTVKSRMSNALRRLGQILASE